VARLIQVGHLALWQPADWERISALVNLTAFQFVQIASSDLYVNLEAGSSSKHNTQNLL